MEPVTLPIHRLKRTLYSSGLWRNWQTRMIQVHVSLRTWRFDSSQAHLLSLFESSATCTGYVGLGQNFNRPAVLPSQSLQPDAGDLRLSLPHPPYVELFSRVFGVAGKSVNTRMKLRAFPVLLV